MLILVLVIAILIVQIIALFENANYRTDTATVQVLLQNMSQ